MCLYGHEIDETTTPVEAALTWSISKRRREKGGFPGAETVQSQIADGTARKRVGILPDGKAPAREGTEITDADGNSIGRVTSGGFGPSYGGPVAMGYVEISYAAKGTPVQLVVRGKPRPARSPECPCSKQVLQRQGVNGMSDLKYSREHEWVRLDGDIATVGISQFAQEQLGDVVFVELPDLGRTVEQNGDAAVVNR